MRSILALILALLLVPWPVQAQDAVRTPDTITADEDTVTIRNLPSGRGTAAIQVSGYCSCTLVIEGRVTAGGDWEAVDGAPTIDADGIWNVTAAGLAELRVRADAWASGTTTIAIRVSSAGGGSGGGGGAASTVAISQSGSDNAVDVLTIAAGNNNIGDVDVASIAAGDNNIGNVDIVSGTITAVTTITNAVTITDGAGAVNVICDSGCAGSGTLGDHDDAITPASTTGGLQFGRSSAAAPTSVSADDEAVLAWYLRNGAAATVLTAAGALIGGDATNGLDVDVTRLSALVAGDADIGNVDLELAGTAVSATNPVAVRFSDGSAFVALSSDATVGTAFPATAPGVLARYLDFDGSALPTATNVDTESEAVPLAASIKGVAYVMVVNEDGSLERGTATTPSYVQHTDPCSGTGTKLYLPVDIVTATDTEITPALAGASTHYYICSINLVTAAANNVALVDDNTDGCGSPTAGLYGGVTAAEGWNFAAGGGLTSGNGAGSVGRTVTTNAVLCLRTSAATQLSGQIVVVAAP